MSRCDSAFCCPAGCAMQLQGNPVTAACRNAVYTECCISSLYFVGDFPCQASLMLTDPLDPPQVENASSCPQRTHQLKQPQVAICQLVSYGCLKLFQSL